MNKPLPQGKPVSQVMKSRNGDLQHLFHKMHEINRLKRHILPMLDDAIKPYVDVSFDFKETLIFIVANDAIALRLRFQTEDYLKRFIKHPVLNHIKKIQLKSQSYKHQRKTKMPTLSNQVSLLSKESAEIMQTTAETITHQGLKAIMQRIAKRIK